MLRFLNCFICGGGVINIGRCLARRLPCCIWTVRPHTTSLVDYIRRLGLIVATSRQPRATTPHRHLLVLPSDPSSRTLWYWVEKGCQPSRGGWREITDHLSSRVKIVYIDRALLWPSCGIGQAIIFSSCGFFFFLSFFFLFFPRIISAIGDWMSIILPQSTHGVALVRT